MQEVVSVQLIGLEMRILTSNPDFFLYFCDCGVSCLGKRNRS